MTDLLGHLFYLCLFAGQVLLARKSTWGWVARFAGDLGWTALGFSMGMSSIWAWGFAFLCNDVRGYLEWREDAQT